MSATERLRALLDERGVKWTYDGTVSFSDGKHWFHAWAYNDGAMCVSMGYLTPEQAIEATLGRGECEKLPSDGITRCFVRRYGYEREFGYWKCSACGCECFEGARYCMGCGRKVRE